jgi:GTPase SAR1 family protein
MQSALSLFSTSQVDPSSPRYCFDHQGPETLDNLQSWIDLFRDNRGDRTVMAICGNKCDLGKSDFQLYREYDPKKLAELQEKYQMKYY